MPLRSEIYRKNSNVDPIFIEIYGVSAYNKECLIQTIWNKEGISAVKRSCHKYIDPKSENIDLL